MNVCKCRLLKKSSNTKLKLVLSTLVTTWLSKIAFHLLPMWLQSLIAIDSESRLTSFPSFSSLRATIWVAMLFCSNLSRRPFLGQEVDLDLLHCTGFNLEHAVLFLCHILNQRSMTDRKIKRSNGRGFGRQQLLWSSRQFHRNFYFTWKQKVTGCCLKFTKPWSLVDSWKHLIQQYVTVSVHII